MRAPRTLGGLAVVALALALVVPPNAPRATDAASHREAPLISLDPSADITDFFMFRSYEPGKSDKVDLIMNVIPGEEPSSGPNYFLFDPNVLYAFNIDNDRDGKADDVSIEFRFSTEIRGTVNAFDLFLGYLGCSPVTAPPCAAGAILPPVTALEGPGSEGLGLRQRYDVTMVRKGNREQIASGLIAVPSNVGRRTMPDYASLAAKGIYNLGNGVKVFAGQRDDPFYIDLGAVFDTVNLRRAAPFETVGEDTNDSVNPFGTDMLSGFNVNTIAIELPAAMLTSDGQSAETTAQPKLGAYASTSRQKVRVLRVPRGEPKDPDLMQNSGNWVQIQRLANPLINETIIGTEDKDEWNARDPEEESRFLDYYLRPRLALALELVYGVPTGCTPFGTPACAPSASNPAMFANWNRTDLVNVLLKYSPTDGQLSELLRLDLGVPPTGGVTTQRRMGILATPADPAAWPNGRRPKDDVTDIAIRVVGGPNYIAARASDGVNTNDKAIPDTFPFLASPHDGRDRQHVNP
jgi:hypothetical protein